MSDSGALVEGSPGSPSPSPPSTEMPYSLLQSQSQTSFTPDINNNSISSSSSSSSNSSSSSSSSNSSSSSSNNNRLSGTFIGGGENTPPTSASSTNTNRRRTSWSLSRENSANNSRSHSSDSCGGGESDPSSRGELSPAMLGHVVSPISDHMRESLTLEAGDELTYQDILDEIALFEEMIENRQQIDYSIYEELIGLRDTHADHKSEDVVKSPDGDDDNNNDDELGEEEEEELTSASAIEGARYIGSPYRNDPEDVPPIRNKELDSNSDDRNRQNSLHANTNVSNSNSNSSSTNGKSNLSALFSASTEVSDDDTNLSDESSPALDGDGESPHSSGDYVIDDASRVSFLELLDEIELEVARISTGQQLNTSTLETLLHLKDEHPEYKKELLKERGMWRQKIHDFCLHSLQIMRSYIPADVFSASIDSVIALGVPIDIAKRVMQKQCLWLTRMSSQEISRMHEVDLNMRYNLSGHSFDIVEISAVYASLPEEFANDDSGKKEQWKDSLETVLKSMLSDLEKEQLPPGKIRHASYVAYENATGRNFGPISDRSSTRAYQFVARDSHRRKSFQDTCDRHSIVKSLSFSNRIDSGIGSGSSHTSSLSIQSQRLDGSAGESSPSSSSSFDNNSNVHIRSQKMPVSKVGLMYKQGHFNVFSWELRKFTLQRGSLKYFDPNTSTPKGQPIDSLAGYRVEASDTIPGDLIIKHPTKRDLTIRFAGTDADLDAWTEAIEEHIKFAEEYEGTL